MIRAGTRRRGPNDAGDHVGLIGPRGLLAATLLRALSDVREGGGRNAATARAWINSDREDHPLSFRRTCESLNLDPGRVRRALRRLPPAPPTRPDLEDDELDPEA